MYVPRGTTVPAMRRSTSVTSVVAALAPVRERAPVVDQYLFPGRHRQPHGVARTQQPGRAGALLRRGRSGESHREDDQGRKKSHVM